jgi:hypothetical protein
MQREQRAPMALFGALVAVGLGPALWLGVQIGDVSVTPKPPVVQSEQKQDVTNPRGGEAAGAEDPAPEQVPQPKRKAKNMPMTEAPAPKPSRTTKTAEPVDDPKPTKPVETAEPVQTPTDDATTTPPDEESTTTPPDPGDDSGTGGPSDGGEQTGNSAQG